MAGLRKLLVASSRPMQRVLSTMESACRSGRVPLLVGEAGTGKHFLARLFHEEHHNGEFVVVDLDTAPQDSLLAELGSMGRRQATLFLREAWAAPDVVQEASSHVRGNARLRLCLSSSVSPDEPLGSLLASTTPRVELIRVPPLRDRLEDLPALLEIFLAEPDGNRDRRVTPRALALLRAHRWPGNVAELRRLCWSLAIRHRRRSVLDAPEVERALAETSKWLDDVPFEALVRAKFVRLLSRVSQHPISRIRQAILNEVDKTLLEVALDMTGWNRVQTARLLGMSRNTLRRRLEELGLSPAK